MCSSVTSKLGVCSGAASLVVVLRVYGVEGVEEGVLGGVISPIAQV